MNPRLAALVAYLLCGVFVCALNAYGLMVAPDPEAEQWREAATQRPILTAVIWTLLVPVWPFSLLYASYVQPRRRR